jgi:hypothetical protein
VVAGAAELHTSKTLKFIGVPDLPQAVIDG